LAHKKKAAAAVEGCAGSGQQRPSRLKEESVALFTGTAALATLQRVDWCVDDDDNVDNEVVVVAVVLEEQTHT
jgi:hypothetical protein